MIELPKWVYKVLSTYGNVALPNECKTMNRKELIKHLTKMVGFKVKIREVKFVDYKVKSSDVETTYLIAEENL